MALTDAVDVLTEIMKGAEVSPANRLTAVRSMLEYSVKLTELTDLAARVKALEDRQNERK